jgi:hypothetical protein
VGRYERSFDVLRSAKFYSYSDKDTQKREDSYDERYRDLYHIDKNELTPTDRYKERLIYSDEAFKEGNFETAIIWLQTASKFLPENPYPKKRELEIILKMPTDTIRPKGSFPLQLYKRKDSRDVMRHYLVNDSSLFNGIWETREPQGKIPRAYMIFHTPFKNGLHGRSESKTYCPSDQAGDIDFYEDEDYTYPEFYLCGSTEIKNDTIVRRKFNEWGRTISYKADCRRGNTNYEYVREERGKTYYESVKRNIGDVFSESYVFNEKGDTVLFEKNNVLDGELITTFVSLYPNLDTVHHYSMTNNFKQGYELLGFPHNYNSPALRYVWQRDTLIDVLNTDAIFTDTDLNIISEQEFIISMVKGGHSKVNSDILSLSHRKSKTGKYNFILNNVHSIYSKKDRKTIIKTRLKMDKKLFK